MQRRFGRIAALAVAAALLGAATPAAQAATTRHARAAASCPGANAIPTAATLSRAAGATLCLLNAQRAAHGLRPVRTNGILRTSARRYAHAMVAGHFFAHVSPGGQTLAGRMIRYVRGARGWSYGENLAWGSGSRATPRNIMRAWMASPGHRANILHARWRQIGVGIAPGGPVATPLPAASYVTHFGWRG